MATRLFYLVRHAQPDFPGGERICLGQKNDLPLSAQGFDQAQLLKRAFEHAALDAVYTSPLLRARQTAQPLCSAGRPLIVLNPLIELHGGEWDGRLFSELRQAYPTQFGRHAETACPPGGESDEQGLARMRQAFAQIERETRRSAVIVAHGGVNRLLLCALAGMPLSEKKQFSQNHASVSIIADTGGAWQVLERDIPPGSLRVCENGYTVL